jgi:hypothetical protein
MIHHHDDVVVVVGDTFMGGGKLSETKMRVLSWKGQVGGFGGWIR